MAKKTQFLTTAEFASKTGIPTASVSKLIRAGKISAEKKSGKWMIPPDQLNVSAVKAAGKPGPKATQPAPKKSAAAKPPPADDRSRAASQKTAEKEYTISEFAGLTYLTEFGVREWLKKGRLTGRQATGGEWLIDAANLAAPAFRHLVRPD